MTAVGIELQPGVYKHYKGGYYLLEFVADFWGLEAVEQDQRLAVVIDYDACTTSPSDGVPSLRIENATDDPTVCTVPLFYARAHGRIEPLRPHNPCAVYVPLYTDKPGLRRSVRPVSEWIEPQAIPCKVGFADGCLAEGKGHYIPRFEYVGETVPQC